MSSRRWQRLPQRKGPASAPARPQQGSPKSAVRQGTRTLFGRLKSRGPGGGGGTSWRAWTVEGGVWVKGQVCPDQGCRPPGRAGGSQARQRRGPGFGAGTELIEASDETAAPPPPPSEP